MDISNVAKEVARRREILIGMTIDEIPQMQCWLFLVFLATMLIQIALRCENFMAIVISKYFAEEHWKRLVDSYNVSVSKTNIKLLVEIGVEIAVNNDFVLFFRTRHNRKTEVNKWK